MKSRICKICYKEYIRERGRSYTCYCSDECQNESKRRRNKAYHQTEAGKQMRRASAQRAYADGRATWDSSLRREQQNKRNRKIRIDVITTYSDGTNACALCGYNKDLRSLDLDHINGDGSQERKTKRSLQLYKELYRLNFPHKEKYRILCRNCNWITYCDRKGWGI